MKNTLKILFQYLKSNKKWKCSAISRICNIEIVLFSFHYFGSQCVLTTWKVLNKWIIFVQMILILSCLPASVFIVNNHTTLPQIKESRCLLPLQRATLADINMLFLCSLSKGELISGAATHILDFQPTWFE